MTIRHIVLLKFTAGTSGQQVAELSVGLNSLPVSIPEIRAYRHGPDAGILDTSWDYAVIGDFDSAEEFFTYREHPLHQKLIREHVEPITLVRGSGQLGLEDLRRGAPGPEAGGDGAEQGH